MTKAPDGARPEVRSLLIAGAKIGLFDESAKFFCKNLLSGAKISQFYTIFAAETTPIMKRKRILTVLTALTALLLVALVAAGAAAYYYAALRPATVRPVQVYIRPDCTRAALLARFEQDDVDRVALFWLEHVLAYMDVDRRLEAGSMTGAYRLEEGLTPLEVARRLTRRQQTPVSVTFNEVRLPEQMAGRLTRHLMVDSLSMLAAMRDPALQAELGVTDTTLLCLFLPDTYQVYWDVTPERLLRRMRSEYDRFWDASRRRKAEALGLTPTEVAILASIAEEETQDRTERGVVARLYWNRLQRGMLLQADPTVKYAVGDFTLRRVLNEHLAVESPYNTYLHAGLPPGPIRCPEKATMDALLNSRPHTYLYMCAKEDFSGLHNFAHTLAEHNQNAARYHRALNKLMHSGH